jgi:hypothetical protein
MFGGGDDEEEFEHSHKKSLKWHSLDGQDTQMYKPQHLKCRELGLGVHSLSGRALKQDTKPSRHRRQSASRH